MKKFFAVLVVAALGFAVSSCSKSPEAEAKAIMNDMAKLFEATADKLDKAATGKEAADMLIAFGTEMKVIKDKAEAFDKAHPELKNKGADEKYKAETEAIGKATEKFVGAMMKIGMKFQGDKDLEAAAMKLGEILK